jgi:hypothetical protein
MSEREGRGDKAAKAMGAYALVMVLAGAVAFALAPEGASATTALAVPAACGLLMVLAALMSRAIDNKYVLGMIGIHLGLILPVLFAVVIGIRAMKTGEAVSAYHETTAAWDARPEAASGAVGGPEVAPQRAAFFEAAGAPDHDKSYLRNTLWFLTAASVIAFGAILKTRPKKSERVS